MKRQRLVNIQRTIQRETYKAKDDKAHVSALQLPAVKVEVNDKWAEWSKTHKLVKASLVIITKLVATVQSIQLNLSYHLEAGKADCRGLSLDQSVHSSSGGLVSPSSGELVSSSSGKLPSSSSVGSVSPSLQESW